MNYSKVDTRTTIVTKALLVIYLLAMVWILLFKLSVQFSYMAERRVNLIPFKNPVPGEIVMNIIVFVPLGLYVGVLFKAWHYINKILLFFLVSLLFETLQFVLGVGSFDSTDLINNTVGGIIGWVLFELIEKGWNNSRKTHRFINIIAGVATVIISLLLVLLKMDMLPIKYR
jgi:glycopeptide antibiotics resistance protein